MVTGIVGRTVLDLRRALHELADTPLWSLSAGEAREGLAEINAARAQLAELELRLIAQADRTDLAGAVGASSTHAAWAVETRQTRPSAKHRLALAQSLDGDRSLTREAMARGDVSEDQATVIVRAVEALPDELDPETVRLAEKELVAQAAYFDSRGLTRLGRRILEVVAPDAADEQERRALEREEQGAAESVRFTMSDDGHGLVHGRFTLPSHVGAMLRKAVLAHWHPGDGAGPKAMGEAFRQYVERYPTDDLPDHGGIAATVVITTDLQTLRTDGIATLDTGQQITAGEARRLACEAGVIPAVLGTGSAVLDVGRQTRFFTKPQRIAIAARDKTCTAEHCDYPPGLCHFHHDQEWSKGGKTDVRNGRLLCPKHHRMIHSGKYEVSPAEGGRLVFRRC